MNSSSSMWTGGLDEATGRFAPRRPLLVKLSPFGVGSGLKLYRGVRSPGGSAAGASVPVVRDRLPMTFRDYATLGAAD
jgi:hypothetical protein